MGPIVVFDKSAVQALSEDEALWFDMYFSGNMTPLFYVETLADLEKAVREGQTPEGVVGSIARKTPSMAAPNVHHLELYLAELAGDPQVKLDRRPKVAGGEPRVDPDGGLSIHFDEFPESAALNRWQRHDFLEIERRVAENWRRQLIEQNHETKIGTLRNIVPSGLRISELADLKGFLDEFCAGDHQSLLDLLLEILDTPDAGRPRVRKRWEDAGRPSLVEFAPFATHVFKVDALFYLGVDRGFISGERASNKVDMAYLYYLPFSMVFTSGDRLRARTVPLFLRDDQAYLPLDELKPALREIDEYFTQLPEEVKERGVLQFAGYPPDELDNAVTRTWDQLMRSGWREIAREQAGRRGAPRDEAADRTVLDELSASRQHGRPLDVEKQRSIDDADRVILQRQVSVRRGKWRMVSKEVEDAGADRDST